MEGFGGLASTPVPSPCPPSVPREWLWLISPPAPLVPLLIVWPMTLFTKFGCRGSGDRSIPERIPAIQRSSLQNPPPPPAL
eukprot:2741471-Heterocapsa_arctica.AAC.1